jgi:hypothetical protein
MQRLAQIVYKMKVIIPFELQGRLPKSQPIHEGVALQLGTTDDRSNWQVWSRRLTMRRVALYRDWGQVLEDPRL